MTQLRRRHFVGREELGLERQLDAEMIAPALQLHHAIGLALRRALGQRQAARDGEHRAEIDRPDGDVGAVLLGDRLEALRARDRSRAS